MKSIYSIVLVLLVASCIPLRIAPTIKDQKIMVAKKFKRTFPKEYAFIFQDPKEANEFYNYINTKFKLDHVDVDYDVPLKLDGQQYFLSFYEAEIPDKVLNIFPIAVDVALDSNNIDPLLSDHYVYRSDNWYIAITILDNASNNCLKPNYIHRELIINYLKRLKQEYLTTSNYTEVLFKKRAIED
ncbi:hypothetical protein [uncultured Psychroserpens sp.]|uniref:hypothetical protein n=1 Tax=uncultured Psychroserpens sp. TaxID=255436 RepID=UPI00260AA52B|nr:hypothetical protein [uncultured Psychroserpens sp.]